MEKLNYQNAKKSIESSIDALKKQLQELTNDYIESNKTFVEGSKVLITTEAQPYYKLNPVSNKVSEYVTKEEARFAFIVGYEVDYNHNVVPLLKKCKKDGTISKNNDYFNKRADTITEVEQ